MRSGLAAVVALMLLEPAQAATPACTDPAHRQFDFWIGQWQVTTPDGRLAGSNRIERILDGCALQESWQGAKGMLGHSYNSFDAARGVWHQTWVDSTGTLLLLEGGLQGRQMVLQGAQQTPQGETLNRISWTPLAGGAVRQLWEQSTDAGQNWSVVFDGRYEKAPP